MYKIEVHYEFVSPFLRVLSGTVKIGQTGFGMLTAKQAKAFPFKKEQNTLGYQNCPPIFSRTKPMVDTLIKAYYDGMILNDLSVNWFKNAHTKKISEMEHDVIITMLD